MNKQEEEHLKKIDKLFDELETEFNKLSNNTKDEILIFHREYFSLNHCIRWGKNSIEELINREV